MLQSLETDCAHQACFIIIIIIIIIVIIIIHLLDHEDRRVFRNVGYKIQTPGNYPEENIRVLFTLGLNSSKTIAKIRFLPHRKHTSLNKNPTSYSRKQSLYAVRIIPNRRTSLC